MVIEVHGVMQLASKGCNIMMKMRPETQVEGVIEEEDVNVSKDCHVDTYSANKEAEDPPPLTVDDHIPIEEDAVNKMKIPELREDSLS